MNKKEGVFFWEVILEIALLDFSFQDVKDRLDQGKNFLDEENSIFGLIGLEISGSHLSLFQDSKRN